MEFLLDTNVFLWFVSGDDQLPDHIKVAIEDPDNEPMLSSVSAAEIAIKHALGKLPLPAPPVEFVPSQRETSRIAELTLSEGAALLLNTLPLHHRDPFDRLLVCQAKSLNLPFAATDPLIREYDLKFL